MTRLPRRTNTVIATCYFLYACFAAAILILVIAVNSQGNNGSPPMSVIFAIALASPVPMLLVGATLFAGGEESLLN